MICNRDSACALLLKSEKRLSSWKFWLGAGVSAFFVWLTARNLEWGAFWLAVREARYWWLLPASAIYFVAVVARTWRWHWMLRHLKPITVTRLFPVVAIGYMGNNVYPARAGELIRSYVLRRREGIPVSASVATVALERLFDGLAMCIFVLLTLPFAPLPSSYRLAVLLCSALFLVALLVVGVMVANPLRADALAAYTVRLLVPRRWQERLVQLAQKFLVGLQALRSPRDTLLIAFSTLVLWLLETASYWTASQAFPSLGASFTTMMLMIAVVNLATMLPSAPGYVGTFDKPGIEVLKALGSGAGVAAAFTIVLHVMLWLPITLVGLAAMARESLHWRDLERAAATVQPAPLPPVSARDVETVNVKP